MVDRKENETTNALEKKTKAEIEEALKEDWMSKKQTIESKHLFTHQRVFLPSPVFSASKDKINNRILVLKIALRNRDLHAELIDEILSDLIVGAYQDRNDLYHQTLIENTKDGYKYLLKMRQSADNHMLNVLRAVRDIKRPPVQVVVKQAQQVNIAEQMNQGDQQVNISKNGHSQNDLDGSI
jgi:hypothetical protein